MEAAASFGSKSRKKQNKEKEKKDMKKIFNQIRNKVNELAVRAKCTMESKKAEGYIDVGVKIIIAVVVGAVILGGLYALFDNVILPRLNTEIEAMFDYTA